MKATERQPGDAERRAVAKSATRPDVEGAVRTGPLQTLSSHTVMRLQSRAGNAAVSRLVAQRTAAARRASATAAPTLETGKSIVGGYGVQRLAEGAGSCPAPPVAPVAVDPTSDSRFTAVTGQLKGSAKDLKKHPSGKAEADKAREAAQAPGDDKAGQAKAAQADKMATAKPKGFDKAGFIIAAVKQAIAKAAPRNLDEADKFATSGKADAVKGEVMGKVTAGKEGSAADVTEKTKQPPDPSVAKDKPVTPLKDQPVPQPPAVDGAKAMPAKAPSEQTDLRAGPCEVGSAMADAEVTPQNLEASNEPQMQQAAAAKQEADAHAAQAPGQIRQKEGEVLQQAQGGATAEAKGALAAMVGAKGKAAGQVGTRQSGAKANEEIERKRISGEINKIFDKTKNEVEAILTGLDAKVTTEFDKGEAEARREFTAKHKADMDRYKDERYSGVLGWGRWTADLFTGLPKEADDIFARARVLYEQKMTAVISGVADLIGRELDAAKEKIAEGRQAIKDFVATQPKELQKLGNEAASEIGGKFDQLESDVDAKQESLVDDLAQKYVEARNAVDEETKAEQAKNAGLVDKAKSMVGDSIQAILGLKDLFMGLLAKAASAFKAILAAPLQFISNFMGAVKQGFTNFAGNILDHLKKGLQGWLFGQLANAGIELPDKFDLMGIIKLIASMLGLTWGSIKARIMAKAPWVAQAIDFIESKVEVFVILAKEGIGGLWNWIKEKVGDVKEMVFGQIKTFVVEKIVKAGITWVLGMLNPAGALIKIVQALISVVQWIMERGAEMGEFIGTIIDAVMDVARGGVGGVPAKIEGALGKAVPLVISFLAGLLGLGGISDKVKSILEAVQKPVGKAIDWVVNGALKVAKPLVKAFKKGADWVKGKVEAGKAFVKKKYEAGKAWVRGKYEKVKGKITGASDSPEAKQKRLDDGMRAAVAAVNRYSGKPVASKVLLPLLVGIRIRYRMTVLKLVPKTTNWAVHGVVNPDSEQDTQAKKVEEDKAKIQTAVASATAARDIAKADHAEVVAKLLKRDTKSAQKKADRVTVASDGKSRREQGGRTEKNLALGQRSGGDQEVRRNAGQIWLEADAARWESGAVTRGRMEEMTRLTPEARAKLNILKRVPGLTPEDRAAKIDELKRQPSSYRYPADNREAREQHFAETGEYIPQRSSQDTGVPGATSSVHAEKLLRSATRAQAIGVSRAQCSDCQLWFRAAAKSGGDFIVVADPTTVRIFMPDGSVKSPTDFG